MAAAAMLPGDVTPARKQLRGLLLPNSERIHFTHEQPRRGRQVMVAMCQLDVQVTIYVARTTDHVAGRRACMKAILDDVLVADAKMLTFELDESVAVADRRFYADRFRLEPDSPPYRQLRAEEEPLLWASDAVAWCFQRGGEWRRLWEPILHLERKL